MPQVLRLWLGVAITLTLLLSSEATPSPSPTVVPRSPSQINLQVPWTVGAEKPAFDFCYRHIYKANATNCAKGYTKSNKLVCSMNCPYPYTNNCGPVCAANGKSCASLALSRAKGFVETAGNFATGGVLHALSTVLEDYSSIKCYAKLVYAIPRALKHGIKNEREAATMKLQEAIAGCLDASEFTKSIAEFAKKMYDGMSKVNDPSVEFTKLIQMPEVKSFLKLGTLKPQEQQLLSNAMGEQPNCGQAVRGVIDDIIDFVRTNLANYEEMNLLYEALISSNVLTTKVPDVANLCFPGATMNAQRDELTKSIEMIAGGILAEAYTLETPTDRISMKAIKFGLDTVALFDQTGITKFISSFVSEFCTPVSNGQAVDGNLAVETTGNGFHIQKSDWKNAAMDGQVLVSLTNSAKNAVSLRFLSGGYKVDESAILDDNALPVIQALTKGDKVTIEQGKSETVKLAIAQLKEMTIVVERACTLGEMVGGVAMRLRWNKKSHAFIRVPKPTGKGHLEVQIDLPNLNQCSPGTSTSTGTTVAAPGALAPTTAPSTAPRTAPSAGVPRVVGPASPKAGTTAGGKSSLRS